LLKNTPNIANTTVEYTAVAAAATAGFVKGLFTGKPAISVQVSDHHRKLAFYDPPTILRWYSGRYFLMNVPRFDLEI